MLPVVRRSRPRSVSSFLSGGVPLLGIRPQNVYQAAMRGREDEGVRRRGAVLSPPPIACPAPHTSGPPPDRGHKPLPPRPGLR